MSSYSIFNSEAGQKVAINADQVIDITEIEPGRSLIKLPSGEAVAVRMSVESVIARLTGQRDLTQ